MCGIAGCVDGDLSPETLLSVAQAMGAAIAHRGPDADGVWLDAAAGVALAHRRLSIIDLSEAGSQPMVSACGRWVLVYNGEVYNSEQLIHDLAEQGHRPLWRGHSDTEAIVEALSCWGVRTTCERLIGMFAFAAWDRQERCLWLARDRMGIKPLYWGRFDGLTLFGSELKALRAHPDWEPRIQTSVLRMYLRLGWIPAPLTIYQGIHKLAPGAILSVSADGREHHETFWSCADVARHGLSHPLTDLTDQSATDQLESLLSDAVQRRMVADVPLGAFLSGGVDSSLVTALMQRASGRPIRTFSIGFTGLESSAASEDLSLATGIARHLGTDHTQLLVEPAHALDLVPKLAEIWDEPFADASQLPTALLSALTRRQVTVALCGDGGDELFAGYQRHRLAATTAAGARALPSFLRKTTSRALSAVSAQTWAALENLVPSARRLEDQARRLALTLGSADDDDLYKKLISLWPEPPTRAVGDDWTPPAEALQIPAGCARMQYLDSIGYLPDDILTKVDRASMAVALEARVPLLDHRVVEWSWRLPMHYKVRDGEGKWLVRQVLNRYVPSELVSRPRQGFSVPMGEWLRGALRPWAEDLLDSLRQDEDPWFEAEPILAAWKLHQDGTRNMAPALWAVLAALAWRRCWGISDEEAV